MQAKDEDAGENAEIKYSLYHVSNNGRSKFDINETTGDFQVVRRVNAGEQYSVTIQVCTTKQIQTTALRDPKKALLYIP